MPEWRRQRYSKLPACENSTAKLSPCDSNGELSHVAEFCCVHELEVIVCWTLSLFTQVIIVPIATVIVCGLCAKPDIAMVIFPDSMIPVVFWFVPVVFVPVIVDHVLMNPVLFMYPVLLLPLIFTPVAIVPVVMDPVVVVPVAVRPPLHSNPLAL